MTVDRRGTKGVKSKLPDTETLEAQIVGAEAAFKALVDSLRAELQEGTLANVSYKKLEGVIAALK